MSNSIVLTNVRIVDPSRNLDEIGAIVGGKRHHRRRR